jgi:hypothetical protein
MKRDLRRYARQTRFRMVVGAIALVLLVGEGLIYLIYGPQAAVTGFICIGAGLVPVVLVIGILKLIEWVVKKANPED